MWVSDGEEAQAACYFSQSWLSGWCLLSAVVPPASDPSTRHHDSLTHSLTECKTSERAPTAAGKVFYDYLQLVRMVRINSA